MGGFDFDRQAFARPTEPAPKPQRPSAIPGSLILLVLLAAGGFAAYRFLNIGSAPQVPENDATLQQINKRLDVLEHRIDQMEKRRKRFNQEAHAASREPVVLSLLPSPPAAEKTFRVSPTPNRARASSLTPTSPAFSPSSGHSGLKQSDMDSKAHSSLQGGASSAQQEWEATANRLGDVVGELATQRNEIDQTQESLGQLSMHLGRSSTSFTLQKGARPQQVGPLKLRLERADVKNQRYTMRLFIGDQSIELRNRALHEAIQFYTSGGTTPFELVISRIDKEGVAGRLTLPVQTSPSDGRAKPGAS